jgi:hypothetical protein
VQEEAYPALIKRASEQSEQLFDVLRTLDRSQHELLESHARFLDR